MWFANRAVPMPGIPQTSATIPDRRPDSRYYEFREARNASNACFDAARRTFRLRALLIDAQEFEVASIKPSAQNAQGQTGAGVHIDGSMARYSTDWMASERWDITAKLPDGSDSKQTPEMSQALLHDRFQMKMRRETTVAYGNGSYFTRGDDKFEGKKTTDVDHCGCPGQICSSLRSSGSR